MSKKSQHPKNVAARWVVHPEGTDARGNEKWKITETRGGSTRTVITSQSSAAAIDSIVARNAKALKRLADK